MPKNRNVSNTNTMRQMAEEVVSRQETGVRREKAEGSRQESVGRRQEEEG